ncbi:hypothetical protein, partial [Plasmodium yoelii yoelii]
NYWI